MSVGPLILASASQRRRDLLVQIGIPCEVVPADVDECPLSGEDPVNMVARLAALKASCVAGLELAEGRCVLAADTIVVRDGQVLGKPTDDSQAQRMLASLAGRWHEVWTAVTVVPGGRGGPIGRSVRTDVHFRELDEATIAAYVRTGEGRDKAGSYGIQGLGGGLVQEIRGSYSSVVGLPLVETLALLRECAHLRGWP